MTNRELIGSLPFAQLVMDATGSRAATTVFLLIILIVFSNATRGNTISASRALLAFGRDGMLPYGHHLTVCVLGEPVWGIILSIFVALLVGLVQFGPAAAFNSLTGSATIFFFM
jgi:amino acid transporter